MKKIIYIAGYGFSGSTLLERILASHSKITGCGEVFNFYNDFKIKETCACSRSVSDCPVWNKTFEKYMEVEKAFDSISVFRLLFESTDVEVEYLCDASKSAWGNMLRPYQLSKDYEVFLIHLIRNGEDCINSVLKRKNNSGNIFYKFFNIFTSGIHWSIVNIVVSLFRLFKPKRYKLIKYESLIMESEVSLRRLFHYLNLDGKEVITQIKNGETIPLTHQLSGNAIRHKKELKLITELKTTQLPFAQRVFFRLLFWPVLKLFGY